MNTKSIIAIILILLVVIFTIQNTEVVTIKFLTFKLSMSRVLVILSCFLIGLVSGMLLSYRRSLKK
ncbi:lipopolysaccharide assembly protein LapA domain-containing protein [Aquaticitalea lipolytica]|uniref:lipopolysaccharide assembly protein LapA domain-containing protein n=1 Tax=Aquaticitalea lipolytica TaxID=1247562 RepID=UPI003D2F180B